MKAMMKPSSLTIPPLIASFFPTNNTRFVSCCRVVSTVATCTPTSSQLTHKPKTPLFLKPPIHKTSQSNLQTFISWAKSLISSQGTTFEQLDNGPDSSLLLRELKWFLDDVVEDPSMIPNTRDCKNVAIELIKEGNVVAMRESLDEMYNLWEERIVKRRPFQYIVGCEHWRDLVLCVEEGVLIPRPETAAMVDVVEGVVGEFEGLKEGVWADLGTGSGALAIGIGRVLNGVGKVVASDVSHVAVNVARYNVERYGLQDIIDVRQGSWFDPLIEFEGRLSGLVSNPPYIPSEDINGLQAEVGKHEPWLALDGGKDGLDYLSYLCMKTSTMLKPGGFFIFETNGEKQCGILAEYLESASGSSIYNINILSDFADVPRFVTGYRR